MGLRLGLSRLVPAANGCVCSSGVLRVFDVQTRTRGESLLLDLTGPLGREGGEMILHLLEGLPSLPQKLVLNFTGVTTMNTAGLGGVLWAVRLMAKAGGQVSAFGLTSHFQKVFYVMGLTQYIAVVTDEVTALQ
jgi:stage II sporulation protein AA (anti-sigma F factor antagonist)